MLTNVENNGRAKYCDLPPNEDESEISVISQAWDVKGPHGGDHHFQFIQTAKVAGRMLLWNNFIRHYKDGDGPDQFGWGHSAVDAYRSSWGWEWSGTHWRCDLIASRVLLLELPCCGGQYRSDKEITDYTCVSIGHCDHCRQNWEIVDGYAFYPRG